MHPVSLTWQQGCGVDLFLHQRPQRTILNHCPATSASTVLIRSPVRLFAFLASAVRLPLSLPLPKE